MCASNADVFGTWTGDEVLVVKLNLLIPDTTWGLGIIPALIGGGLGALGSAIGGAFGASAQDRANEANIQIAREAAGFSAAEAHRSRLWQQEMMENSYLRTTRDLERSGLNPMMMLASGGGPSGGVGGATASGQTAHAEAVDYGGAIAKGLSHGVQSAMELARFEKEMESQDAQIKLAEAGADAKRSEVMVNQNSANQIIESTKKTNVDRKALEASLPALKAHAEIDKEYAGYDAFVRRLQEGLGAISSGLGSFFKARPPRNNPNGGGSTPPVKKKPLGSRDNPYRSPEMRSRYDGFQEQLRQGIDKHGLRQFEDRTRKGTYKK